MSSKSLMSCEMGGCLGYGLEYRCHGMPSSPSQMMVDVGARPRSWLWDSWCLRL